MSFTVPAAAGGEPEITVPARVIGEAAEILALAAELIDTAPGARGQAGALMGRKGAEPGPAAAAAADWMIASVAALARETDAILAYEGIAFDRGLARYWRRPGTR
jgi:hypothetical protein